MLPQRYRLKPRQRITATIRHGRRARRGSVVLHVQVGAGGDAPPQAAFAVSRSVGDSVTRHRVVRRLRALMPPLLDRLPGGTQVVVRAMPEAAAVSSAALRDDLERALERVAPLAPDDPSPSGDFVDQAVEGAMHEAPRGWRRLVWWAGWPVRTLLIGLVWVYRHTISPILPPTCRYHPSCSAYGFQALQLHGAAKGTLLTAWRVLRCNPFTPGGLDPVPPRGAWRPGINPDGTPRVASRAAA